MASFSTSIAAAAFCLLLLLHLRGAISAGQFIDGDYLGLALNLEYLETEFFLYSAFGHGLDVVDSSLAMGGLSPIGARKVARNPWDPKDSKIKNIIAQFGYQEVGHLKAIKAKINGFPRPLLNLSAGVFANIMNTAFDEDLSPPFDPYASDLNNLLAAYVIPYVGLTGYVGAAPNLQDPAFKKLVAGLLGVESGQDAVIRSILFEFQDMPVLPYKHTVAEFTVQISALRNKLGNKGIKDEGIVVDPSQGAEGKIAGNVLAGDVNSVAYDRSPEEILRIVYGTGNEHQPGGFFPNGGDGKIANTYHPKQRA